jgi:hypothetical protein
MVAITCLVFLAAALLMAHSSPATGYELSIYASTPFLVWGFLILALAGGLFLIVHQVITEQYETGRIWLIGFVILLLAHVSLIYIRYIRGYTSWQGDNITHWGFIKDVITTGQFSKGNAYPVTHILLAQVASVAGLPVSTVANLSTCFLSVGFVLSTYLLATAVLQHKGQQLLAAALAAAALPLGGYHYLLMPNGWSIMLFPLLLFAVLACDRWAYLLVAVILIVLFPFFHPLSSLMAAVALLAIVLLRSGLRYVFRGARKTGDELVLRPILTLAGIELAILFPWLLSFQRFEPNVRSLWDQITTGVGADPLAGMGQSLDKVNVHGLGFLLLLVKMHGVNLILIITAVIGGLMVISRLRSGVRDGKSLGLLALLCLMFMFGTLYLLYLVGVPGLGAIGAQRLLSYTLIPTTALSCSALYQPAARLGCSLRVAATILFTIMLAAILSMLSLYDSPYLLRPNLQVSQMEMTGMDWFVDTKNRNLETTYIATPVDRFADALLGIDEANKRGDIGRYATRIPDHFGYGDYATLGEQYPQDIYAVINGPDIVVYDTVWKEVGRFSQSDSSQLQEDGTVVKVYANGELDVYLIRGLGVTS